MGDAVVVGRWFCGIRNTDVGGAGDGDASGTVLQKLPTAGLCIIHAFALFVLSRAGEAM
jgi:hypothetical protein